MNTTSNKTFENTIFNPRWFMENMLYIVDKGSRLVPFRLNEEQSKMLEYIEFCLDNDLPIRIIVLKARQIGSTTFFIGLGFWFACMHKNIDFGIVAHKMDSSKAIFGKCNVFYNNLPIELRPETTQMSNDGITFDKKDGTGINSKIHFATATSGVYRGRTLSYRLETERAFWDLGQIDEIDNSLSQTVADLPNTIVVKESTAKGYNFFKDEWDKAVRGESSYKPFFFGWQDHSEYTIANVPKDFKLTDEELRIKERFPNITDGQLLWRRKEINDKYKGDSKWFNQENPMTPEDAFVASGGGVFSADSIQEGYRCSEEPDKVSLKTVISFEKLNVWEYPQVITKNIYQQKSVFNPETRQYEYVDTDIVVDEQTYITPYTIGVDTSGLGQDVNQIIVINNVTKKLSARYSKVNMGEEELAKAIIEIAKMYNNALVAVETNYSHEICNYIAKLGYTRLYVTENIASYAHSVTSNMYGWITTNKTKNAMISLLKTTLDERPDIIKDREFWYEAEYYLMEDPIKVIMNAAKGHHDDIIMATAIALYVSSGFQAQQTATLVETRSVKNVSNHWLIKQQKTKSKKTKLKRGIYTNNA